METPTAQEGTWTLTAPDGRTWEADNPIQVVAKEQRERVPAETRLERMIKAIDGEVDNPSQPDEDGRICEECFAKLGDGSCPGPCDKKRKA